MQQGLRKVDYLENEIGLIITECYISDFKFTVPQIIVEDAVQTFKKGYCDNQINE